MDLTLKLYGRLTIGQTLRSYSTARSKKSSLDKKKFAKEFGYGSQFDLKDKPKLSQSLRGILYSFQDYNQLINKTSKLTKQDNVFIQ